MEYYSSNLPIHVTEAFKRIAFWSIERHHHIEKTIVNHQNYVRDLD